METKIYEIHYLLSPDLSEDEAKQWANRLNSLVTQNFGGRILEQDGPSREALSYPVKKHRIAVRLRVECELARDKVNKLLKELEHEKDILRIFVLTKPKEPSVFAPPPVKTAPPSSIEEMVHHASPLTAVPAETAASVGTSEAKEISAPQTPAEITVEKKKTKKERVSLEEIDKHLEELLK